MYSDILIKNKVHNILIDKYIKRYIPLFAFISQKIYQTKKGTDYTQPKVKDNHKWKSSGEALSPTRRWISVAFPETSHR